MKGCRASPAWLQARPEGSSRRERYGQRVYIIIAFDLGQSVKVDAALWVPPDLQHPGWRTAITGLNTPRRMAESRNDAAKRFHKDLYPYLKLLKQTARPVSSLEAHAHTFPAVVWKPTPYFVNLSTTSMQTPKMSDTKLYCSRKSPNQPESP